MDDSRPGQFRQFHGPSPARRRAIWLVLLVAAWVLAACSFQWSVSTPPAKGTPIAVQPGGSLLRPFPPTPQPPAAVELLDLSTEEQLVRVAVPTRDLRDLALRFTPGLDDIPLVVNAHTPDYAVGERVEFWAHELGVNRYFTITAELIHKTDVAYAWVEADKPVDAARLRDAIDHFSRVTYPALTAFFGSEWKPGVDNDPRLHILHVTGIGSGIAGYYSSSDQVSRLARPFSNEREMFYINLDWLNSTGNYTYYETVLAHEFQHMIHWYKDRNEETWLNEGLSEYAQEVAGFAPSSGFARGFTEAPETQLNAWGSTSQGNGPHYGAAYLMVAYFAQRLGPEMVRALVAHPANGIHGFDAILAASDSGLTFNDLFADWVVANYVDDPQALGQDGVYGYRNLSMRPLAVTATVDDYPANTATTAAEVSNYATHYIHLRGAGSPIVTFQGAQITRLADLPPHPAVESGRVWWSHRGDHFNSRLTRRVDLRGLPPGSPVALHATLWWDIEDGYDYGYVAVSRDGRTWTPLAAASTRAPAPNQSALGPGYSGQSRAWQTETFDLTAYAGEQIQVRFEYVTDDAINAPGWFVAEVAIPAIGYSSDWNDPAEIAQWESEGWLLTDNRLPQHWMLQLLTFEGDTLVDLDRIAVNAQGRAVIPAGALGNGRSAVLAISGLTPVTTHPAAYTLTIDPSADAQAQR